MAALFAGGGGMAGAAGSMMTNGQSKPEQSGMPAQQQPGPVSPQNAAPFAQGMQQGPPSFSNLLTFLQSFGKMGNNGQK